jgi:hypothetical protein
MEQKPMSMEHRRQGGIMIGEAPFKIHSAAASVCADNNKVGVRMTMPNYYYRQLFMIYMCGRCISSTYGSTHGQEALKYYLRAHTECIILITVAYFMPPSLLLQ